MNNQKNNLLKDPKTNWKYIGIVVILAVIVGGGSLWCLTKKEPPYQSPGPKKSEKVSFEQLSTCNADSDCILVTHKSCGGTIKISINKKYESQYNSTSEFQDSTGEICQTLGISYDEQRQIVEGQVPTESLCVSNKCIPKYLGDEIANWKTYRNEEYGFEIRYPEDLTPRVVADIPAKNIFSIIFGDGRGFAIGTYDASHDELMRRNLIIDTEREILIGNKKGSQFYACTDFSEGRYMTCTLVTMVKNKGTLYSFSGGGEVLFFGQILSTFKFLE